MVFRDRPRLPGGRGRSWGMPEPMLVVRFPGGGHLSIEFTAGAPDDDQPRLGAWLELRASDPAAVMRSVLDAGLTEVTHPGHPVLFPGAGRPGVHHRPRQLNPGARQLRQHTARHGTGSDQIRAMKTTDGSDELPRRTVLGTCDLTLLPESVYLQVTGPSGHFREEAAPVMSPYPQAASALVARPPDLQRWPDYTYLVATRTGVRTSVHTTPEIDSAVRRPPGHSVGKLCRQKLRRLTRFA